MRRLWPRSLLGQLMLIVALAVLFAQAINFALHYTAGERLRFAEAAAPLVVRIAEAEERGAAEAPERRRGPRRRFFRVEARSAVASEDRYRIAAIERRLRRAVESEGLGERAIEVGRADAEAERFRDFRERRFGRHAGERRGEFYRVAVPLEDGRWLNGWLRLRPHNFGAVGLILAHTIVLYLIVLLAVWWFARRVSRPLDALTRSAENFEESAPVEPLEPSGPSDVARLTVAYNTMRDRIAAMLAEKDHMLGAIGHDLRTPLAALRIRAENVEDATERTRMIETIEDMNETLEDILSLARLGRAGARAEALDLTALVDSAIEDFRDVGEDVELADGERIVVQGRANLLKRAIRNLIGNAVRYGERARVAVRREAGQALIEIADEGPGIDAADLERVFEPFARLEGSRNRERGGTGLGLALARAIVRDHGGALTLENGEEGGLLAVVALPMEG
ncbi:MAG: HAMP domain-containing protein [Sphingomonadales bacterium]|nr:HAMP domain-containing protein [Sphingomonadales bacterium]